MLEIYHIILNVLSYQILYFHCIFEFDIHCTEAYYLYFVLLYVLG